MNNRNNKNFNKSKMIELKTNKQYIIQSNSINHVKKIEVLEVTNTTYLIRNIDATIYGKERLLKRDFNRNYCVIEEMDSSIPDIDINANDLVMKARNYGNNYISTGPLDIKQIYDTYKWTPFNTTLD